MMEAVADFVEDIVPVRIINITKHFAERWAGRVLEVGKDVMGKNEKERVIKEYAAQNFERIKEHANKTFQHAEFVFQGQLFDNITRKYYIEDDIIFVLNTTGDAMVTNWKVDFGFPGDGNTQARKALVKEIHRLSAEKEEADFQVLVQMEQKQSELEVLKQTIQFTQDQLVNLKEKEVFVQTEIKNMNRASNHLDLEVKKYTNMLVNSLEYREDLKVM